MPDRYQPRQADIEAARKIVVAENVARAVGLHGMGGIGKSVLATALVHDPKVREAFPYGVAWLSFGRQAQPKARAADLARALTNVEHHFLDVEAAQGQLNRLTADKRLLVVLDDVRESEAVDPFARLGSGCLLLVTTRDLRVLERAQAVGHELRPLEPEAARTFLAEAAGGAADALPADADQVVMKCSGLPLALAAVGALIRRGTYGWRDALEALQEAALEELDTRWLPDPQQKDLAVVLKVSIDALSDVARACFIDCAAFPENVDIPEAALQRLWSERTSSRESRKIAQELVDCSLMRRDKQRRYRIHDLYMSWLQHFGAPLLDRHRYLLARYAHVCPDTWHRCPDDGYCVQHIAWHLREADEATALRTLLFDPAWLKRKLVIAGIDALIGDYGLLASDPELCALEAALTLSADILARDKNQLSSQLVARLKGRSGPDVSRLLDNAGDLATSGWLRPLRASLTPPGALQRYLAGHTWKLLSLSISTDGNRVVSSSGDHTIRIWDTATWKQEACIETSIGDLVWSAVLTPDRRHVIGFGGFFTGSLFWWDVESGELERQVELIGLRGPRVSLALTRKGCVFAAADSLIEIKGDQSVPICGDTVALLATSNDGTVVFACRDGSIMTLASDTDDARPTLLARLQAAPQALAIDPAARFVAAGCVGGDVLVWSTGRDRAPLTLSGHTAGVRAVAVTGDPVRVVSCSDDQTLRVWDGATGRQQLCIGAARRAGDTGLLVTTSDGRYAIDGFFNALRVWDLHPRSELGDPPEHGGAIKRVVVSSDGGFALSASEELNLAEMGPHHRQVHRYFPCRVALAGPGDRQRRRSSIHAEQQWFDAGVADRYRETTWRRNELRRRGGFGGHAGWAICDLGERRNVGEEEPRPG